MDSWSSARPALTQRSGSSRLTDQALPRGAPIRPSSRIPTPAPLRSPRSLESRGRAGKIRVRPRGNLWATGGQHNGQGSSLALGHPHLPPSVPSAPPCPVQDRPRSRLTTTRGSLWLLGDEAGRFRIFTPELTGHFMGKKSLEAPSPSLLGTVPQISPRAQRLQRSHDLLGILRLKKAVGPGPGGPAPHTQEAAGANAAEVMPLMRKIQQRGSDCAHPGKVLHGTLVGVPPGCKSWAQISVTPFL
ncbi:neuromedin-B isoform X3 [Manis javanica]|uniref:neuromedin-B isoform X3 n=1 Tax=Manis javanica TaxID=9974 RepID=UPI003C6D840B